MMRVREAGGGGMTAGAGAPPLGPGPCMEPWRTRRKERLKSIPLHLKRGDEARRGRVASHGEKCRARQGHELCMHVMETSNACMHVDASYATQEICICVRLVLDLFPPTVHRHFTAVRIEGFSASAS